MGGTLPEAADIGPEEGVLGDILQGRVDKGKIFYPITCRLKKWGCDLWIVGKSTTDLEGVQQEGTLEVEHPGDRLHLEEKKHS